jgi:hypothetical protein
MLDAAAVLAGWVLAGLTVRAFRAARLRERATG